MTGSGQVTAVHAGDDAWEVSGVLDTRSHAVTGGELVLVTRRTGDRIVLRTEVTPDVAPDEVAETRRTRFTARVGPEDLNAPPGPPRVPRRRVRRGRGPPRAAGRDPGPPGHPEDAVGHAGLGPVRRRTGQQLRAYRTFKSGALAFEFRPLDVAAVDLARTPARSALRLRWQTRKRPVWLVGERPDTAQDTGIALYRYLREEHPEIDARYVISADSPDRAALEGDPGLLTFGSREHVEATLAARRRILSSHHTDYLLATRNPAFQRAVRARRVFLQHGVMGTKNMVANYGWSAPGFSADAFVVSSERERRMIVEDFGWPEDRVVVTGLSRHDRLFEDHAPPERRLLIMPTWRDWLKGPEDVLGSESTSAGRASCTRRSSGPSSIATSCRRTCTCTRTCSPTPTCSTSPTSPSSGTVTSRSRTCSCGRQ